MSDVLEMSVVCAVFQAVKHWWVMCWRWVWCVLCFRLWSTDEWCAGDECGVCCVSGCEALMSDVLEMSVVCAVFQAVKHWWVMCWRWVWCVLCFRLWSTDEWCAGVERGVCCVSGCVRRLWSGCVGFWPMSRAEVSGFQTWTNLMFASCRHCSLWGHRTIWTRKTPDLSFRSAHVPLPVFWKQTQQDTDLHQRLGWPVLEFGINRINGIFWLPSVKIKSVVKGPFYMLVLGSEQICTWCRVFTSQSKLRSGKAWKPISLASPAEFHSVLSSLPHMLWLVCFPSTSPMNLTFCLSGATVLLGWVPVLYYCWVPVHAFVVILCNPMLL